MPRTPLTPEPTTERQVIPGIVEAHPEVHADESDFGVIPDKTQEVQERASQTINEFAKYGDEIQISKMKNAYDLARNSFLNEAQQTKGVDSGAYAPTNPTGKYQPWLQTTVKNVSAMAGNDSQKNEFLKYAAQSNVENQEILQKHVGQQIYESAVNEGKARTDNLITSIPSIINSPSALSNARSQLADQVKKNNDLTGGTADTYKLQVNTQNAKFDGMVVSSLIGNKNIDGAKAYLDKIGQQGDIDKPSLTVLQGRVTDAKTTEDAQNWYLKNQRSLVDNLGRPNATAIQSNLDKLNLTPQQRQIYEKTIQPMIQTDKNADVQQSKSAYEGFKNWFGKASNGATKVLDPVQIQNMANFYAPDQGTALTYEKWANSFYKTGGTGLTLNFGGGDAVHQNKNFQEMRFQIQTGQVGSVQDLDAVQKDFTGPQFMKLRDEWYKTNTGSPSVAKQAILKQARSLGSDVFGNDAASMRSYMHAMMDQANDIGDGDMHKLLPWAKKYLEGSKPDTSTVWQKQVNANIPNDALRGYYADYGKEFTDMMVGRYKGAKGFTPDTMTGIINALGGPDKMARFSPTNNAVLSILRWNQDNPHAKPIRLTVDSVNAFEDKYKTTGGIGFAP